MDQLGTLWEIVRTYSVDDLLDADLVDFWPLPEGRKQYWLVRDGTRWSRTDGMWEAAAEALSTQDALLSAAVTTRPSILVRGIGRFLDRYEAIPAGTSRGDASAVLRLLVDQAESAGRLPEIANALVDNLGVFRKDPLGFAATLRIPEVLQGRRSADIYALFTAWFCCSGPGPSGAAFDAPPRASFTEILNAPLLGTHHRQSLRTPVLVAAANVLRMVTSNPSDQRLLLFLDAAKALNTDTERFALAAFVVGRAARRIAAFEPHNAAARKVAEALYGLGAGAVLSAVKERNRRATG